MVVNTSVGVGRRSSLEYTREAGSPTQQDQPTRWGSRCSVHSYVETNSVFSPERRTWHQTPFGNLEIKYEHRLQRRPGTLERSSSAVMELLQPLCHKPVCTDVKLCIHPHWVSHLSFLFKSVSQHFQVFLKISYILLCTVYIGHVPAQWYLLNTPFM